MCQSTFGLVVHCALRDILWVALLAWGTRLAAANTHIDTAPSDLDFLHGGLKNAQSWLSSSAGRDKIRSCLPQSAIPWRDKNLTATELELLPSICWRRDLQAGKARLQDSDRGIPAGVKCKATHWCAHQKALRSRSCGNHFFAGMIARRGPTATGVYYFPLPPILKLCIC